MVASYLGSTKLSSRQFNPEISRNPLADIKQRKNSLLFIRTHSSDKKTRKDALSTHDKLSALKKEFEGIEKEKHATDKQLEKDSQEIKDTEIPLRNGLTTLNSKLEECKSASDELRSISETISELYRTNKKTRDDFFQKNGKQFYEALEANAKEFALTTTDTADSVDMIVAKSYQRAKTAVTKDVVEMLVNETDDNINDTLQSINVIAASLDMHSKKFLEQSPERNSLQQLKKRTSKLKENLAQRSGSEHRTSVEETLDQVCKDEFFVKYTDKLMTKNRERSSQKTSSPEKMLHTRPRKGSEADTSNPPRRDSRHTKK